MMNAATYAPFAQLLEEQRRNYASTLPGRIAGMDQMWRAIARHEAAPDDLDRLVRVAHGLAGSGAVFGFDRLSVEARTLELELQVLLSSRTIASDGRKASIDAAIARVQDCVARPH
jgi:HPt (histidine-containing phosphotransfer) domain-containing protein